MQWPGLFFVENLEHFFSSSPINPAVASKDELVPYFRNDTPMPNDINGALGEYILCNQAFSGGICEKVTCIPNLRYTDLRLNIYGQEIDFEVKTWVPFWKGAEIDAINNLKEKYNHFSKIKEDTHSKEKFYVQLLTLIRYSNEPKYSFQTNILRNTAFDLLFIADLENHCLPYINSEIHTRWSEHLGNIQINWNTAGFFEKLRRWKV